MKDMRPRTGCVEQELRMSCTCDLHLRVVALAVILIAASWWTGRADARDLRAERVLTSCRSEVMRFCDRFKERGDEDIAIFCLRGNFESLRTQCRRMIPIAAKRSDGPVRRINKFPLVLHRETERSERQIQKSSVSEEFRRRSPELGQLGDRKPICLEVSTCSDTTRQRAD